MRLCLTLGYLGSSHSQPKKASRYTVHTITFRLSRAAHTTIREVLLLFKSNTWQQTSPSDAAFNTSCLRTEKQAIIRLKYAPSEAVFNTSCLGAYKIAYPTEEPGSSSTTSPTHRCIIKPCACEPDPTKPHTQKPDTLQPKLLYQTWQKP